jgi:hypothetical protein
MCTGTLIILCQWHLFGHFLTNKSIHTSSAVAKHCDCTVLILSINFHISYTSTHGNQITVCNSSVVHVIVGAAMMMPLVVKANWTLNVKKVITTTGRFHLHTLMAGLLTYPHIKWLTNETAEATNIVRSSFCMQGIIILQLHTGCVLNL